VYSDTAQMSAQGGRDESRWDAAHGWEYYDATVDGRDLLAFHALAPTPHNVSYIWYAPNHVRAFRRAAYDEAGGYDAARDVADDHDLMCRLYQRGEFVHIDECLYLQRMHPRNTQREPERNAAIQAATVELYQQHVQANALAWAARNDLLALDLGAAHARPDGYLGVDKRPAVGVDLVADVADGIDLPDNSVGVIRAVDFLEHIADRVGLFNEIHRLLAPDGLLLSLTPSTDGRGAFQDPTHRSFYNENAFWYFTDAHYAHYVPEIACRFQVSRLATYHPSPWHEEHQVPYVQANLIAVKDGGHRNGGPLNI
jgi:SAM-dependent methyltransferase